MKTAERRGRRSRSPTVDGQPTRRLVIPFLTRYALPVSDSRVLLGLWSEQDVPRRWIRPLEGILYDALDLEGLVTLTAEHQGTRNSEARRQILEAASLEKNVFQLFEIDLPERIDVVLLAQGYGGVFAHAVQLWEQLNRHWNAVLISPVPPPYGYDERLESRLIVYQRLRDEQRLPSYFSFLQVVRGLLNNLGHTLLYIEHRSQSIYSFDLLGRPRATIIHDDGFYDNVYHGAAAARIVVSEARRRRILSELYYAMRYNDPDYFGMNASPANNRLLMESGWLAIRAATENWHWSMPNHELMRKLYGGAPTRFRFVPPMIDTGLYREGVPYDPGRILFTTTMHNIRRKGIVELARAMRHVPEDVRAVCVIGQPKYLPEAVSRLDGTRLILEDAMPKERIIDLYHRCAVNCRVSREESSPVSVLEGMACGLPLITSPTVQENIPILEDGATGFIVDPHAAPEVLGERLTRVCRDRALRARMSAECRKRVERYSLATNLHLLTRHLDEPPT